MAQHFNPPGIWQPFGAFAMGVALGEGRPVLLKGQVALDRNGDLVGRGDMAAQLRQVLDNVAAALAYVGGGLGDVVSLTQYTTDIEAFMALGHVRTGYFSAPYPVTTTLQVARLYDPDVLIEIQAVAEVPVDRYRPPA